MALVLGLIVAASFGSGDFLGGLASRRARTLIVLLVAQACALAGAVVVAIAAGGDPSGEDLALGASAGLLTVVALGCLYQGLAIGEAGLVAPVAAVLGAVIPVGYGLATGERPGTAALVGIVLAIVAGALISLEHDELGDATPSRAALLLALAAGAGFGASLILYGNTSDRSEFWPVLSGRVAAVSAVAAVLALTRTAVVIGRGPRRQAVGAGVLDLVATTLLLIAIRDGLFSTVAPVAALAPGFTVGNAWWYLHERPSTVQSTGLVLALVGLVLIGIGTSG
jgi:drug/metabolite transporter (DMT)-like permease